MQLLYKPTSFFSNVLNKEFKSVFNKPCFAKLTDRSIIVVHGAQTRKFLQGLATNNISLLYDKNNNNAQPKISLYSLFLGPKGKVISDAFIFRPMIFEKGIPILANQQLWIDVCSKNNSILLEHLKKYTWKKKVQVLNLHYSDGKPDIHVGFNDALFDTQKFLQPEIKSKAGTLVKIEQGNDDKKKSNEQDGNYANVTYFDPRGIKFGVRIICGSNGFIYRGQMNRSTQEHYNKMNLLNGVSSSNVMVNKLPFMYNTDLLNGFSFNKGCYLGQQIAARAYNTGIVRRRIFPYVLENSSKIIPPGQTLYGQNKIQLGKVVESQQGCGTVQFQYLPYVKSQWPLKIESPQKGLLSNPLKHELNAYLTQIQAKQAKLQEIDL